MEDHSLIAIGGIAVEAERLRDLETALEDLCARVGFGDAEFKWSPPVGNWMREHLIEEARDNFFLDALAIANNHGAVAFVCAADTRYQSSIGGATHERATFELFLERYSQFLRRQKTTGIVIADQPGGARREENKFLADCINARTVGTQFENHDTIALNVLCAPSHHLRPLQLADLVTSCSLARIAGSQYAKTVFENGILPILGRNDARCGGVGLKLHPDYRYANLYHWLVGDQSFHKLGQELAYPVENRPYATNEETA